MSHAREFEKQIRKISHRHNLWQVFADFCELAALTIYNQRVRFDEERENRYLETIRRYEKEDANGMAALLAITTHALAEDPHDFLGQMFMSLELSDHWRGQFFTPYHLCQVMAAMTFDDENIEKTKAGQLVSIQEPACGGGAMVIAVAEHVKRQSGDVGFLRVHAVDVDRTAANMAYIQFSLLGIPAAVYTGNTLTAKMLDVMVTPAWLEQAFVLRAREVEEHRNTPTPVLSETSRRQLSLFGEAA